MAETLAEQLRRFNEERERLLGGQPITEETRIPGPWTGVGGDVPAEGASQ